MDFPRPDFMRLALRLARKGTGRTSPNPAVGAVVVGNGRIVGTGYHRAAGMPHAEAEALRDAGGAARGGDLYVTLEPCAHTGRTGPCTEAIIAAGVKRVAAAMTDPNPIVAGKGFRALRRAGIRVASGGQGRLGRYRVAALRRHECRNGVVARLPGRATKQNGAVRRRLHSRRTRSAARGRSSISDGPCRPAA